MESISCIICGSDDSTNYKKFKNPLNSATVFNLVKCTCSFIYLNPRPDFEEISKYYNNSYLPYSQDRGLVMVLYSWIKKITFFWKYKILSKYNPVCQNILDYGGGTGDFSSYLLSKNISAINYDPNTENSLNLSNPLLRKKFDAITLWHSMEHIHDIKETFSHIDYLLKKSGFLLIAIPNHDAYERKKFFNHKWIAYDIPRHLYHFNIQTFKKLLKKNNFIIEDSYSMYQDTLFNILMSSTNKNLIKLFYRTVQSIFYISLNKELSSSLLFICRKR